MLYPCLYVNIQAEGRGEYRSLRPFACARRGEELRARPGGEGECAGEDEGSEEVRYSGERGC